MPSVTKANVSMLTSELRNQLKIIGVSTTIIQVQEALAWSQSAKNYGDFEKHLPLALDSSDNANKLFSQYLETVAVLNFDGGLCEFPNFRLENILASIPGTTRIAPDGRNFGIAINWNDLDSPISEPFVVFNEDLFDGAIRNDRSIFVFGSCFSLEEWQKFFSDIHPLVSTVCAGYIPKGPKQEPVFNRSAALAFGKLVKYFEQFAWRRELKPLNLDQVTADYLRRVLYRNDIELARLAFDLVERCSGPCDSSAVLSDLKLKRDSLGNQASIPIPAWLYRIMVLLFF